VRSTSGTKGVAERRWGQSGSNLEAKTVVPGTSDRVAWPQYPSTTGPTAAPCTRGTPCSRPSVAGTRSHRRARGARSRTSARMFALMGCVWGRRNRGHGSTGSFACCRTSARTKCELLGGASFDLAGPPGSALPETPNGRIARLERPLKISPVRTVRSLYAVCLHLARCLSATSVAVDFRSGCGRRAIGGLPQLLR